MRNISPLVTRGLLAKVPVIRDRMVLTRTLPPGTMRLDRHPAFVTYLAQLPRTEIGLHGLHHIHPGKTLVVEFQDQSVAACTAMLREGLDIFARAKLPHVRGMTPPGWNAPPALLDAMVRVGLEFVASSRDIRTAVAPGAQSQMSGLRDVPLYAPARLANGLVHIPANFQATSPKERAFEIVELGGLLSIKAHIVKNAMGMIALDGIDALYCNYLDSLLTLLDERYGERLWWTSMSEIATRVRAQVSPVNSGIVA